MRELDDRRLLDPDAVPTTLHRVRSVAVGAACTLLLVAIVLSRWIG